MGKLFIVIIGIALVVILGVSIVGGMNNRGNTEQVLSQQQTQQIMLQEYQRTQRLIEEEQTKREAQQLRSEETSRAMGYLAMLFGTVIGLILLFVGIIFLNDRIERNRLNQAHQMQLHLYKMNELQAMENTRLLLQQPKQVSMWGLTGTYDESEQQPMLIYKD